MTIEGQIKDEKLQYDINRDAAKISALSSGKLDKYEYFTGEEILPSNQQQIIQQAKFNYSPLGKAIEKQRKTIEDQGEKQVVALESLKDSDKKLPQIKDFIPMKNLNPEIINEIKKIEEIDKKFDRNRMVYKGTNKTYDFRNFKTIRAFGNEITNYIISVNTANIEKANLLSHINDFIKTKPRDPEKRKLKVDLLNSVTSLVNGPHLEIVELVLVHCNLVNNDYQQDSRILHIFVPNKTFGSLLEISPTNQFFLKTFNSEFQEVKIWFTDQTSKPLELEDKINITLIIK